METFVIHSRLWDDPAFAALSDVGQLTFLRLFRLCDGNWGVVGYRDLSVLAAEVWPDEVGRMLQGDTEALARIAEAEEQLALAISSGLLISEETRDGWVLGFRSWESYTGAWRKRRRRPDHPMGPRLAVTRDWSQLCSNSVRVTQAWGERLGLPAEFLTLGHSGACSHNTSVAATQVPTTLVSEQPKLREHLTRGQGPGARGQVPGARCQGPGALRAGAREDTAAEEPGDGDGSGTGGAAPPRQTEVCAPSEEQKGAASGAPTGGRAGPGARASPDAERTFGGVTVEVCRLAGVSADDAGGAYHVDAALALIGGEAEAVQGDAIEYAAWCRERNCPPSHHGLVKALQQAHERRKRATARSGPGQGAGHEFPPYKRGDARERMTPRTAEQHAEEAENLRDPAFVAAMKPALRRKLYNVGAIPEEVMPVGERAGAGAGHTEALEGA